MGARAGAEAAASFAAGRVLQSTLSGDLMSLTQHSERLAGPVLRATAGTQAGQHSCLMDHVMLSQSCIGDMHPPASRTTAELARSRIVFGPPLRDPPKMNKRNTARK